MQDHEHLLADAGAGEGTQQLRERRLRSGSSGQMLRYATAGTRLAAVSRSEQGLPPTVQDEAIIAKVAALLRNANGQQAPAERRRSSAPGQAHAGRIKPVPNLR